ncbi:unnamed protein product [Dovyalis caffra]|uniref:Malectin-like domain-containing protein n=1 Tax=Dovyalis caffra TaxID=77055 RepID=A0AAV1SEX4_9ROSI|nr:unnamed protein product [Dovyalis caffra]
MEENHSLKTLTFSLLIVTFSLFSTLSLSTFAPTDSHLISCGSTVDTTVDGRRFISDSNPNSPLLSSTHTIPFTNQNPSPNSLQIYNTARIFKKPSKYALDVKEPGVHMVRLHFHPFVSSNLDLNDAQFHVLVNGYVVLSNFSVGKVRDLVVKEYFLWVDSDKIAINFVPAKKGNFGFVNAIEVISAPKDLIADVGFLVNGNKDDKFEGLTKQALETVHRINVGGPKVTPFNDTVWRTWIPDDGFFKSGDDLLKRMYFSARIHYKIGGASREVGPDFVYNTARVISSTNGSILNVNMTWEFPVDEGYKYLVRLHFCDIASISLGLIHFNVYVNGYLAYEDLDLSSITYMLASPFYADFVVVDDSSGVLSVSVGPSKKSRTYEVDGILNGVEIMKMNNSAGSLDGKICAGMVLKSWPRANIGVLVPFVAVVFLLLSLAMIMHWRTVGMRNPATWSKLPTEVPGVSLNHGNQHLPGKA